MLIHLLAISACFFNTLPLIYKGILIVFVVVDFIIQLKRSNQIFYIRQHSVNGWQVAYKEGKFKFIELLHSTVISSIIIVLHFKLENNQKRTIIICNDSLSRDKYRKLKVALKISNLDNKNERNS